MIVRTMLDTNVLLSMFLFPSGHFDRLKMALVKQQIVLCTYVVDEVKEVVRRKFPKRVSDIDKFFQSFPFAMAYTPDNFNVSEYPSMRDENDVPIRVTAILEDIDVLISGDKDFTALEIEKPEILTPSEFIERYG
jgi:putative PIN family toxin of toxin-antitoxin system